MNFYEFFNTLYFYFAHFHLSCQISGQTDNMPRNESKHKIKMLFLKYFLCIFTYNWKSDILSTFLNFDEFKKINQVSKITNENIKQSWLHWILNSGFIVFKPMGSAFPKYRRGGLRTWEQLPIYNLWLITMASLTSLPLLNYNYVS